MTAHRWRNSAGHLIRVDGHHVRCETCPCEGCPEGSSLYKIKYAEKDTSCTAGAANEYRLNISCECKCLITGEIPNPIPEGKTAADYYNSYPLTGQTGETYWKRTIAGGPFVDDDPLGKTAQEKCDDWPVEGCAGFTGCGWYKIRKAYYDAACDGETYGYNADGDGNPGADCECRCLISGAVPNPLPAGRVAADYTGYYASVDGQYRYDLFGPYSATCDLSADAMCAAAPIEGCDYAWGGAWNATANEGQFWYKIKYYYHVNADCTGGSSFFAYSAVCNYESVLESLYLACDNHISGEIIGGPAMRACDIESME